MNDGAATRLGELFRELNARAAPLRDSLPAEMPTSAKRAAADPSRCIDEFVLVEPAGVKTTKAWDRLADRWVAFRSKPAPPTVVHPSVPAALRDTESYLVTAWIEGASFAQMKPTALVASEAVRLALAVAQAASVPLRPLAAGDVMLDRRGAIWILAAGTPDSIRSLAKSWGVRG